MIRRRDSSGPEGVNGLPTTAREIGRNLRRVRTRRGLRLEDVAARTSLALGVLEALETASVENAPDRVEVLRTLRRYADFLGLPGDRYVIVLVDNWPAAAGPPPRIVPLQPDSGSSSGGVPIAVSNIDGRPSQDTGVHPAVPAAGAPAAMAAAAVVEAPASPKAPDPGPRPRSVPHGLGEGARSPSAAGTTNDVPSGRPPPAPSDRAGGRDDDTGAVPAVPGVLDTGLTSAVAPLRTQRRRRSGEGTPLWAKVVFGIVAVVVVLGVGALVVDHYEPHWLHGTPAAKSPPSGSPHGTAPPATHATMVVKTTSPTTAAITVDAPIYLVEVTAVGAPCWMQATAVPAAGQSAPAPSFSGVVNAGDSKFVFVKQPVTLETGSTAALVELKLGKRTLGTYRPTAAPFTVTLSTRS